MASRSTSERETDLCAPVRDYLTAQGYTVRSEVHNCDVVAVKGEDVIVVELKRALNLALIVQAAERQRITDSVYVAVPRPSNMRVWNRQTKGAQHILRRLEIGLVLVSTRAGRPAVDVLFHPLPFQRQKRKSRHRAVISEVHNRTADFNEGGSCRRKLVTAYRESAIRIACCLCERGPMSPKDLRALGTGDKTLSILRGNVYSWFERVSHGVYALTSTGAKELSAYPELVEHYTGLLLTSEASCRETPPGSAP